MINTDRPFDRAAYMQEVKDFIKKERFVFSVWRSRVENVDFLPRLDALDEALLDLRNAVVINEALHEGMMVIIKIRRMELLNWLATFQPKADQEQNQSFQS